jgi:hypothetical protein
MDGESSLEPSTTFLCGVFLRPSERARELRDSSRSGSAARGRSMCLLRKIIWLLRCTGVGPLKYFRPLGDQPIACRPHDWS